MRSQRLFIPVLGLLLLLMVGCQTRPGYTLRDVQPLYDEFGHARSLTLTTPVVRTAMPAQRTYEPWYAGRRDIGPFVTAGSVSPRYEQSVTTTRDSQYIFNGRVYDRYRETTYRRTYSESTR
jgi:hypothetical protein